jgi:hypothetical protein
VHSDEFASSLCVRVTVTDERTGRMALLWEVSNVKRVVKLPNQYWEAFLPTEDSSFVVRPHNLLNPFFQVSLQLPMSR